MSHQLSGHCQPRLSSHVKTALKRTVVAYRLSGLATRTRILPAARCCPLLGTGTEQVISSPTRSRCGTMAPAVRQTAGALVLCLLLVINSCDSLDNGVGRTPAMGWNSWNTFRCDINETLIKEVADAVAASGLREAGFKYINIDDCWQEKRDRNGTIQPFADKFPSGMKALADYVHSKGLLFGLYSDTGAKTCEGYPGSWGHERQVRHYACTLPTPTLCTLDLQAGACGTRIALAQLTGSDADAAGGLTWAGDLLRDGDGISHHVQHTYTST
jgi:hypothetical protein